VSLLQILSLIQTQIETNNPDKILNIINDNYENDTMLKEQQNIAKLITSEEIINTYLISLFKTLSNQLVETY
jgi:hypothetical protein